MSKDFLTNEMHQTIDSRGASNGCAHSELAPGFHSRHIITLMKFIILKFKCGIIKKNVDIKCSAHDTVFDTTEAGMYNCRFINKNRYQMTRFWN